MDIVWGLLFFVAPIPTALALMAAWDAFADWVYGGADSLEDVPS